MADARRAATTPTSRNSSVVSGVHESSGNGVNGNGNGHHPAVSGMRSLAPRDLTFAGVASARLDFIRRIGQTFLGKRDIYTSLGYADVLSIADYRERYQRGGIAERIVEAYPLATWAGGARIVEDPDPDKETDFEHDIRILFGKLDVWSKLTRADILASLGHFSAILIGASGNPETPLGDAAEISYLKPVAEDQLSIIKYDEDKDSPRFGKPEMYQVTVNQNDTAAVARKVHHSRILHVAEGLLEDDIYGKPRLRAIWNYLDDLDKIIGGGAEASWKRADPGLHIDVDPEIELGEDEEELLSGELDDYQNNLRRMIRTRGTKINPLATQIPSFGANADAVLKLISATTGIPHRILTGSERGELASSQDRFNWSDRINERRRGFATPLVRQFIQRLIDAGVVSAPKGFDSDTEIAPATSSTTSTPQATYPGGYDIVWPEVGDLSNEAKADIANKLAAAAQAMSNAGMPPPLTTNELRHLVFGLGPIDEKEIAKWAEAMAQAKAEAAVNGAANGLVSKNGGSNKADGEGNASPNPDPIQPSGNNAPAAPSRGAAAGT